MSKSGLTKSRIFYEFDPFELVDVEIDKADIPAAKEEIANFVKEQVLSYVGSGKSPVANGSWKRTLSPAYKKLKAHESSSTFANLELTGDMLDHLDVAEKRGRILSLEVTGAEEVAKADGHNNFSGKSKLPEREFIPKDGETFKRDIVAGIRQIAEKYGKSQ